MAKKPQQTPDTLFEAARRNDVAAVQVFLAEKPDLTLTNEFGFTALHQAILGHYDGQPALEAMKLLVEAGSPINQKANNESGRTPLYLAAEFSLSTEPVIYLLDHGADPTIPDADGHLAAENAWSDEVRALLAPLCGLTLAEPEAPLYPDCEFGRSQWQDTIAPKLKTAFAALMGEGIYSLQNAGYTQADGWAECFERLEKRKDAARFHAYCFYTPQDRSSARRTGSLYLGWGICGEDQSRIPAAAEKILKVLKEQGLQTEWNGNAESRIRIWLQPLLGA